MQAIQSVEVTATDGKRDGFRITFSAGRGGGEGKLDYPLVKNPLLSPFSRVIIMVSFGVILKVLIDGIITHHQLAVSNDPGKSSLTVIGEDVSVMMDKDEKPLTHDNLPDFSVAAQIIGSYQKYGLVPLVVPPDSIEVPTVADFTPTQRATDLAHLKDMAKRHNYVFYVEPTDVPKVNTGYWGPSNRNLPPQKALSVNMGRETNVGSISFDYDPLKPHFVKGKFRDSDTFETLPVETSTSLEQPLSSNPAWSANQQNIRTTLFSAGGVDSLEARTRAQAETDASMDAITASGEIDSVVYGDVLRARRLVWLRGAGSSYDGLYKVKSVSHKIKVGEYRQSFRLAREGLGTTSPVVTP